MATGGSTHSPPHRVLVQVSKFCSGLERKLQKYFQSPRKSGGGECTVKAGPTEGTFWVEFLEREARQRVLERQNHELELPGEEKLKLTVRLLTANDADEGNEEEIPTEESKITDGPQEQDVSEDQDTKLPLERRWEETKDMSKGSENVPSLVALKNLHDLNEYLLVLLVENISGLSKTEVDFEIEIIPEVETAVFTFLKHIDTKTFVDRCSQNRIVQEKKICVAPLEETRTILVENLPPDVNESYITLFFENPNNGGGPITKVQCFPKDDSALIEFSDSQVVKAILTKKLLFNNNPISMFPYYCSLGTALYGQAKPPMKLPEPLTIPVEPYLLKFLQKDDQVIGEITSTMESCHCKLTWPTPKSKETEIILSPSATLVSQRRTKSNIIKTWSEDVSLRFSCLMSEYQVRRYNVDPGMWEAIRDSIENKNILTKFDKLQETVIIAGRLEDVQRTEPQMKTLIEKFIQKIEREKQSISVYLTMCPGRFSILCKNGLEETLHKDYPELEVTYNALTKSICLTGWAADVYKAKSEILEKLQSLAQKALQAPPQIIQFLQQVNCEAFSDSLFGEKKIPAAYELEGEAIGLVGASPQILSEAEEHMKKVLDFKCISVVDSGILKDFRWKKLTDELNKKYNCSSKTVMIEQQNSDTGIQIIIAGFVSPVCGSYRQLYEFIEKNTKIQELVTVKSLAVIQYMKEEKKQIWKKLKKKHVKIDYKTLANQTGISLSGPKGEVMNGVAMVKEALGSIHVTNFSIDKPGAKSLFKDKEDYCIREAKRRYNCLICLQEDVGESSRGSTVGQKIYYKITLESGILLTVQKGDLTQFSADVVVNAANEDLKHSGGLAAALSKAAGPELQRDCDQIIRKQGKIPPGWAVVSTAGQLPYKQVIHAVGPKWTQKHAHRCVQLLKNAITECLYLAGLNGHTSIAIPALSSGVFGFPLKECAETIIQSIKENFQDSQNKHSLKKIHLVDSSEETAQTLSKAVRTIFKDALSSENSLPRTPVENQKTTLRESTEHRNVLDSIQTSEHLSIILMRGDVQDVQTDLIVNSIPLDLHLDNGPLSQALLKKAGPELQEELNTFGKTSVKTGHVLLTRGYNLGCRFVLHVVAPAWDNGTGKSQKIMEDIITECLETAASKSLTSITFPAIGTGNLRFPKTLFAKLILSLVLKFSSSRPLRTLKEVCFLLHPSDINNIQAFEGEFTKYADENTTSGRVSNTSDTQDLFDTISSPELGVYERKLGSVTLQVASGDIAKEESDVIVNSTDKTFVLKKGVSKAILEAAGPAVESECATSAANRLRNFIVTEGGNLRCKKIIHVIGGNDVKQTISEVLQECEQMKYASISLPAIGTGQAKQDPTYVAESIIDAIEDFARGGSGQSVKKVKVVIFLPQLVEVFLDTMKKRVRCKPPTSTSVFSKIKSFFGITSQPPKKQHNLVLEKIEKSATFQVCGESKENVESAIFWIQDLILKEHKSCTFSDEPIRNFGEKEYKELNELQKRLNVIIDMKHGGSQIEVTGTTQDVFEASQAIQDMIKRTHFRIDEESKAEELSRTTTWQYSARGLFKPFDKITNLHLEDAMKGKKNNIVVKIKNEDYTVDFNTNLATNVKGHSFRVHRIKNPEVEIPDHWDDMKNQNLLLVDLPPGHEEYKQVKDKFFQTCANYTIEKIQRIQNKSLWNLYKTKKIFMDDQNNHKNNERCLFHGTDSDSVSHVNSQGFNRSYAGKNATVWGKGTYFAVNALYSANDTYSKPDINGKKHMYYVRVLTGDYTLGDPSFIVPPPKRNHDIHVLYDSVTDHRTNPRVFVIFYDNQAYPEYLITFRK
ncbi:protein mono-ADP-ribosyltransferase PARP14-like isoform X1 [Trichosurus vulpecula]|uniref:protein mono-ADP-ribosyltransferase PARP14-like isoform X1 n=1 Tax=Trichosurus vulpecula TaxID=9337 RepID=UPI00186AE43B|nr:protein mono-ADP-ribosyltransferase PARP14-like isoform X1 [Trichosurus vulpecula]